MYLEQPGLDVLIIHELGENEEFLPQKLVCEVDLKKRVNTCTRQVELCLLDFPSVLMCAQVERSYTYMCAWRKSLGMMLLQWNLSNQDTSINKTLRCFKYHVCVQFNP